MPSAIAAFMKVVLETYRRALETQVDVDKVEPHNLKDKVLAFIRNNTSGSAPMDIGAVTGTRFWRFQPESHGVSDSHSDLNNHECASQWGQDWFGNSGDVDTSGGPDGELYGLQKGKGAKRQRW